MIRKTDFFYHREFRYFNDYILEEIGMKLTSESNLLTSRYEALYLFKSESDSMRYLEQLPKSITSVPIYLLKIELINKEYLEQFDNNWLNQFDHSFTAKDYENQAKDFLSRKKSKTPLYEVLFKGEYKVVECKLIL